MKTQELLYMVNASEKRDLHMDSYYHDTPCGTKGCLVGNYALEKVQEDEDFFHLQDAEWIFDLNSMDYDVAIRRMSEYFGIPERYVKWLFIGLFTTVEWGMPNERYCYFDSLNELNEDKRAVKRLRKFIYFKLKQAEIHEAWNERHHTRHAQAENTAFIQNVDNEKIEKELATA
jgi:hypothetical protein